MRKLGGLGVRVLLLLAAIAVGGTQGCDGDDDTGGSTGGMGGGGRGGGMASGRGGQGGGDPQTAMVCGQLCDRISTCLQTNAAGLGCVENCTTNSANPQCTNLTAIMNALQACLATSCDLFAPCVALVPPCQQ